MNLEDLDIADILALYTEKQQLTQEGNFLELLSLKKKYPDLFISEKEQEINKLLEDIKFIISMPDFQEKLLAAKKKNLIVIDYDKWQTGILDKELLKQEKIFSNTIYTVSVALVKEAVSTTFQLFAEKNLINFKNIFPLLGLLLSEILKKFPIERKERMLKVTLFKLSGDENFQQQNFPAQTSLTINYNLKNICKLYQEMVGKILVKFDMRQEFYMDSVFFLLIECAEFIGKLIAVVFQIEERNNIIREIFYLMIHHSEFE